MIPLTAAQQQDVSSKVQEYIKCKQDPVYFCEKYIKIKAPGGDTNIKLYGPQKDFIKRIYKDHYLIALKTRQIGISTIAQLFCTHVMCFYKNVVIGIVSRSGPEATDFTRKTMDMIESISEDWLKPKFKKKTEQTFILDNGCQFFCGQVNNAAPDNLFRSRAITILIIDEAAFISNIDKAYTGCSPSVSKAQKTAKERGIPYATLIISTPNKTVGRGKWYYDNWMAAANEDSIYKRISIHWTQVDELKNDPNWYKDQCRILGNVRWRIAQELDMQFVASEDSYFSTETIEKLNKSYVKPINVLTIKPKCKIEQFKLSQPNKFYLIGVDTASAGGDDFSAIVTVDYETLEQVAEFKGKLRVEDFCKVVTDMAELYPNCLIIPEANSYGNQVVEYLTGRDKFYNIYQSKSQGRKNSTGFNYGLWTGSQTRPLMMDALYTFVDKDPEIVKSEKLALELLGLVVSKSGKVQADEGEHDDLALALSFCCYVRLYDPPLMVSQFFQRQAALNELATIADWNNEGLSAAQRIQNSPEINSITSTNQYSTMTSNEIRDMINGRLMSVVKNNIDKISDGECIDLLKILNMNQY